MDFCEFFFFSREEKFCLNNYFDKDIIQSDQQLKPMIKYKCFYI